MITTKKLYELFETDFLMQRQNPGGTSPYLKGYLLGFAGKIDINEALSSSKTAELKLKVGNGIVQTKPSVNFTSATPGALTPAAAATALQAAGFTGCTFSVDDDTGRLKLVPSVQSVKWVQIYGDLAAALGFGNCRLGEGKGCFIWASFDGDLKQAAETENWEANKEIVNESPIGTPVKVIIPGRRTGTQIVLTDRVSSRIAKQMINGGIWKAGTVNTPETYEPPAPGVSETRNVDVFTYAKMYDKYNNNLGSEVLIREKMYVGCVGSVKRANSGGTISDQEYALTANSYTGEDGKEHASPKESDYTIAQWDALGMSGIIVSDWENA